MDTQHVKSLNRSETSRKNGTKSKGPVTKEGKQRSRLNATKHGLLSKDLIIEGVESRAEFNRLLNALTADLRPSGVLELMLVEEIAVCSWRLRRVIKAETSQVQLQRLSRPIVFEMNRSGVLDVQISKLSNPTSSAAQRLSSSAGVSGSIGCLEMLIEEVKTYGYLRADAEILFRRVFAHISGFLIHVMAHNEVEAGKARESQRNAELQRHTVIILDPSPKRTPTVFEHYLKSCSLTLLQHLEYQLSDLRKHFREVKELEFLEDALGRGAQAIPEQREMDKILRYETTIKRQKYRAMDQLERLQRRRKGEYVPPPVKVKLERED